MQRQYTCPKKKILFMLCLKRGKSTWKKNVLKKEPQRIRSSGAAVPTGKPEMKRKTRSRTFHYDITSSHRTLY